MFLQIVPNCINVPSYIYKKFFCDLESSISNGNYTPVIEIVVYHHIIIHPGRVAIPVPNEIAYVILKYQLTPAVVDSNGYKFIYTIIGG